MRKVKDLKDNNGEKFYPKSHAKAVYLSDGNINPHLNPVIISLVIRASS